MSCNGCRILRKGCGDTCILRPCLQWIDSAEAQGHATVFLAKFFGRAGLMSSISAVPENQRPALFQSLLFEAAGRTVSPVSGAVGLLWTGNWHVCQAAVETVLRGGALKPIPDGGQEHDDVSDCTHIFTLKDPTVASVRKIQKRGGSGDVPSGVMKVGGLDLNLTAGFPVQTNSLSPAKQRAGSPSMNSEESIMSTCGDQPAETQLLKLF